MKAQLEAEIAALEAALAAKKAALESWLSEIPAEFHHITSEVWATISGWFGSHPAATSTATPPAPPASTSASPVPSAPAAVDPMSMLGGDPNAAATLDARAADYHPDAVAMWSGDPFVGQVTGEFDTAPTSVKLGPYTAPDDFTGEFQFVMNNTGAVTAILNGQEIGAGAALKFQKGESVAVELDAKRTTGGVAMHFRKT